MNVNNEGSFFLYFLEERRINSMPLVATTLAVQIANMIKGKNPDATSESQADIDSFAQDLADIITDYIKTATVTVSTTVIGTSATGGPVTGTGSGSAVIS